MHRLKELYVHHRQMVQYLIFGALTTAVNYAVYFVLRWWMNVPYLWSNGIAWAVAVTFAYSTNRIWVFESKRRGRDALKEAAGFYASRLATLLMESALLYLCVDVLRFADGPVKIVIGVLVIIANYALSKWVVFQK